MVDDDIMDVSEEVKLKAEKFWEELKKEFPTRQKIELKPYRGETTVFDSKFGGVPYMPKSMEYPTVKKGDCEGNPLRFLAQLNFEKLPHIEGFPEKGILQFFAGCDDDDLYGMDFENQFEQNSFRIIYHENIIEDESQLMSEEDMPEFEDDYYPVDSEFALKVSEPVQAVLSSNDYRFDKAALKSYNRAFGTNFKNFYGEDSLCKNDDEFLEYICETDGSAGSCIGGFPHFTQDDPRTKDNYAKCDILLLQIDSQYESNDGGDEIMWGDCGVANFFISAEDLAKRDFSNVLYNWDCC